MWSRVALAAALFALNAVVCHRLFSLEYSQYLGSIEGAYVSISRYLLDNWRDLSWCPLWYGGIPFQNTYPPLLHVLVALVAKGLAFSPARAHHAVSAFFYCLGPVALYGLCLRLSSSAFSATVAGVLYSSVSPSVLLVSAIRNDVGGWLRPRRLHALVGYGEGPHITALALLPIALLCFDLAMEKRRPGWYLLSAVTMAAVALSNWLGAFALALGIAALLAARTRWEDPRGLWRLSLTAGGVGLLAYLLVCPWLPPSTILTIQRNSQSVGGEFDASPLRLIAIACAGFALLAGAKYLLRNVSYGLQFSLYFAASTGAVTLLTSWAGINLVPQPARYHLEMDLAFCLTAAIVLSHLPKRPVLGVALAAFCLFSIRDARRYARDLIRPVDFGQTLESQAPLWFREHAPGSRVMVPGTVSYWLNAFSDTPQLAGGFDQGVVNPVNRIALYILPSNDGAGAQASETALLWLRAFGVNWLLAGGPNSREQYKAFRDVERFQPILDERWREGDDVIYHVPRRSDSLAQVVRQGDMVVSPPENGIDLPPLRRYVGALENPDLPLAAFQWRSRHEALITANIRPEHVLSVQISYVSGWHASVQGRPVTVFRDGLGLLAIRPGCSGPCAVQLVYDGGIEAFAARWLSAGAWVFCLCWVGWRWKHPVPDRHV